MPGGTGGEPQVDTTLDRLGDLLWKALPAIGSAIGFAGFVAIIGAALLWLRFETARLPATQALLAVPRQELVITGGWALAFAVLGGLVAALLVYMCDSKGDATVSTARGIAVVASLETLCALYIIHPSTLGKALFVIWVLGLGAIGWCLGAALTPHLTRRRKLKRLRREVLRVRDELAATEAQDAPAATAPWTPTPQVVAARRQWTHALGEWETAVDAVAWTKRKPDVAERLSAVGQACRDTSAPNGLVLRPLLEETELQMGGWWVALREWTLERLGIRLPAWIALGALTLALAAGLVLVLAHGAGRWAALILAVACVLAVTNMFIAYGTEKFLWYGVSVFFSVVVFGAVLQIVHTVHYPVVQPVALLRKDNTRGICGVFVTQTSERVYIGRLAYGKDRPGVIFWVPTSEVEAVSVGPLEPIDSHLQVRESSILARLYGDRAEEAPTIVKNRTVTVVRHGSGAKAGRERTTTTETPAHKYGSSARAHVTVDGACHSQLDRPDPPKPIRRLDKLGSLVGNA